MSERGRIVVIAKERSFDAEKWKRLLTAFAYVLHERRTQHAPAAAAAADKTVAQIPGETPGEGVQ